MELSQPCLYSFQNLLDAAKEPLYKEKLYSLPQNIRNQEVKRLCKKAGWFYKDIVGVDNVVYTAFSPVIVRKIGENAV